MAAIQNEGKTLDPFNWPTLKREDLMSLNSISKDKDLVRVKTAVVSQRLRSTSMNLETNDIRGNFHSVETNCYIQQLLTYTFRGLAKEMDKRRSQ